MDTSLFTEMNWLAVLVAAIAYFLLGALWYSNVLFGKSWIAASGIDMSDPNAKKGVGGVMFLTFVLILIICIGLGLLVNRIMLTDGVLSGIKLGLLTGICFSFTVTMINHLYQRKPRSLTMIDAGYHIVGQVIAAIILCVWL